MGAQNKRFRAIRNMNSLEESRSLMQEEIDSEKDIEERRKYGQFSTPFTLAQEIITYSLNLLSENKISFLEPCIGSGAFYSALLSTINSDHCIQTATGVEIDPTYYDCAVKLWNDSGIELIKGDFTRIAPKQKYNLIIANPPYVRHHYLTQAEKSYLLEREKEETGIGLSGLAGLYCHFILFAHKWLAPGAICGWLIPSEFMDVNYGNAIKEYLLQNVHLLRIHRYDPENPLFNDALVSSCVVWFKNETVNDDYEIEFSFGGTHDKPVQSKYIKKTDLITERKWTRFPEKEIRYKESTEITLGDFFEIKRGLATGDNSFFIMSRKKIIELGLDMSFFKPILPSPRYLKTDLVRTDNNGIPQIEPQYFLLDCKLTEQEIMERSPTIWDYLQNGLESTSTKYLCKNRKIWYWQEHRDATFFLCSYMGRGKKDSSPIRFILNLSEALATNSYLMLYPKEHLQKAISDNPNSVYRIWESLKGISGNDIEEEGRIYGGGLKKNEPSELAKVSCGDLMKLCFA